jgi:hypothetical protein
VVNNNRLPSPGFFVSVDSMGLAIFVTCLESSLVGDSRSVDSKGDGNSAGGAEYESGEK